MDSTPHPAHLLFVLQYSISVVYSVPKRPWGRSEVQIYINGELKKITVMRTPNFSDVRHLSYTSP